MNSKKHHTEEFYIPDDYPQDSYRTGSTQPPKSHGGLIAVLLGLVIFLCGIVTALSMMNIKLRWQLDNQIPENLNPVAFSRAALEEASVCRSPLGFSGQDVTSFWNHYRDLPQGIYITEVDPHADAAKKGIAPGDILLSIDGNRITSNEDLDALLCSYSSGQRIVIGIHRNGKQMLFQLHLG